MTLQDQIAALCAEAEPLRGRHDGGGDELRLIVDQINALRVLEASAEPAVEPEAKRRGRPPKVTNA